MTEGKLAGKVAIVTGAGNGLAHCATVLAEHGARVAVVDIRLDAAREVVAAIEAKGGTAMAVETDVSAEDAIRRMVAAVVEQWGRIDVLHNNAAALDLKTRYADRDVCNVEIEAWDRSMDVNARGAMLCCKHVIPVMLRNGGGSVIHSSSGLRRDGRCYPDLLRLLQGCAACAEPDGGCAVRQTGRAFECAGDRLRTQ
jgi:NAD(P)-dependent dehydrogenase (short-subunit alcohol dehydrogenase family)